MKKKENTKRIANIVGVAAHSDPYSNGITLVSLIITIIVMLILVGVSVMVAINGGLFDITKKAAKKTDKAKNAEQEISGGRIKIDGIWYDSLEDYTIGKASANQGLGDLNKINTKFIYEPEGWTNGEVKVKIETTAVTEGYTLQYKTDDTDWDDYTTETEIKISVNRVAIYARLLDSEGNSGEVATGNVGNIDKEDPRITASLNSPNQTMSSIKLNIGVKDDGSGISKIEWHYKLSTETEYKTKTDTYTAEITKEGIKETTLLNLKAGTYNIYAEVYDVAGNSKRSPETGTIDIKVKDINFEPNGAQEWKKSHSVKVTVNGTIDSMKYKWMTKSDNVSEEDFANYEVCNNEGMIEKTDLTGKYYLWVNATGDDDLSNWKRSDQSYYFDNTPPEVELETEGIDGATIKLTAKVTNDQGCGEIKDYRFFVDDEEVLYEENSTFEKDTSATVQSPGKHSCAVEVTDATGNYVRVGEEGETKLYTWNKYLVTYGTSFGYPVAEEVFRDSCAYLYRGSDFTHDPFGGAKRSGVEGWSSSANRWYEGVYYFSTGSGYDTVFWKAVLHDGSKVWQRYSCPLERTEISRSLIETYSSYDANAYTEGEIEGTDYIIERAD